MDGDGEEKIVYRSNYYTPKNGAGKKSRFCPFTSCVAFSCCSLNLFYRLDLLTFLASV